MNPVLDEYGNGFTSGCTQYSRIHIEGHSSTRFGRFGRGAFIYRTGGGFPARCHLFRRPPTSVERS